MSIAPGIGISMLYQLLYWAAITELRLASSTELVGSEEGLAKIEGEKYFQFSGLKCSFAGF